MPSLIEKRKYHLFSRDDSGDVGMVYHGSFIELSGALAHVIDDQLTQTETEIWENSDCGELIVTHNLVVDCPSESYFVDEWRGHNWNQRWEKVVIVDD